MKRTALGLVALGSVAALTLGTPADAAHVAAPKAAAPAAAMSVTPATYAGQMAAAGKAAGDTAKSLGLGAKEKLVVTSVITDPDGSTHTRYDRTYAGMKVIGGDLIVKRDAGGKIVDTIWNVEAKVSLPSGTAKVTDAGARQKAVGHSAKRTKDGALKQVKATKSEQAVILHADGTASLVRAVTTEGVAHTQTPSRQVVMVDASTGAVVSSSEQIHAGTGRGVFVGSVNLSTTYSGGAYQLRNPSTGNYTTDMNNGTSGTGTQFTDSDDAWGTGSTSSRQSAAVDAQFGADTTFAYFKNVLGRNGIRNNGTGARSRVHYGNSYVNAFWDGTQMTYGDGRNNAAPLTELDVASHEMTHGVTENTANLDYGNPATGRYVESGGLNEATSDIFGVAVEFHAALPADNPDYYMGELINLNGNGTPLRYMDKPSKDGVSLDCYSSSTITVDPHYSSGPLNHWFYMAAEGSGSKTINGVSYNSPTCGGAPAVTGAGRTNIEKVWYRTLSTKLTTSSNYRAAREGAIKSAIELYGSSSAVCTAVEKAFNAITVPKGTAACSGTTDPGPTDPTPTGSERVTNGGFESGSTGWTGTSGPITNNAGRTAHSGSWKMWLGGNGTTSSEYEQQTVTIPSTSTSATLTYWVSVDSSETTSYTAYDKASVTVTPSGGTARTVASYSNLTKGAWKQVTVDLSAYKGQSVTLKFSATEDSSAQTSFVFDDVSIKA